ncbi:hypothetical protein M885DRAFT_513635, partial [Pelagophyceae sp. CCMP2097]
PWPPPTSWCRTRCCSASFARSVAGTAGSPRAGTLLRRPSFAGIFPQRAHARLESIR